MPDKTQWKFQKPKRNEKMMNWCRWWKCPSKKKKVPWTVSHLVHLLQKLFLLTAYFWRVRRHNRCTTTAARYCHGCSSHSLFERTLFCCRNFSIRSPWCAWLRCTGTSWTWWDKEGFNKTLLYRCFCCNKIVVPL